LPDDAAPRIYTEQIAPHLRSGQALGFIHGFNIANRQIAPPADADVILVAPKAQGHGLRSEFVAGRGVAALVAIEQDATGRAMEIARGWAAGLGCYRVGLLATTFRDETETDLFGEQSVLCGGLTYLVLAAFETLTEAGYPPELAYFECCHELKLITDLVHREGLSGMLERISSTARFGAMHQGGRIIDSQVRSAMQAALAEIQSGEFARKLSTPVNRAAADAEQARIATHEIERVGRLIRGMGMK
jgi:ketol-acid reductoisomerase